MFTSSSPEIAHAGISEEERLGIVTPHVMTEPKTENAKSFQLARAIRNRKLEFQTSKQSLGCGSQNRDPSFRQSLMKTDSCGSFSISYSAFASRMQDEKRLASVLVRQNCPSSQPETVTCKWQNLLRSAASCNERLALGHSFVR